MQKSKSVIMPVLFVLLTIPATTVGVLLSSISFAAAGEAGVCQAMGRVGDEDVVCGAYRTQATCESTTDWAWCQWNSDTTEPVQGGSSVEESPSETVDTPAPVSVRGTGPIHVECTDANGVVKAYNVNELNYHDNGADSSLTAIGFGPNRQDDGIKTLEGSCFISLKSK